MTRFAWKISICLALFLYGTIGMCQSWAWVNHAVKGNGSNYVNALCTDVNDNVYITGRVKSTGVFGTGTGGVTLTNFGDRDIYLSKYNTNGGFNWVRHYGGTGSDYGYGISSDTSGNTYLTGHFTTSGNFGTAGTISAFGSSDIYLLKHDPAGALLWVKHFGSSGTESGYAISTSKSGISAVGGEFADTSMFDTIQRISKGSADIFIGKFDENGNPIWVRAFGSTSDDAVFGVFQDEAGYVYATGKFTGTVNFDGIVLVSTSAGNSDIVTLKLDPNGNVLWAQKRGSGVAEQGQSIATDKQGNVIVCGYWAQTNIITLKYSPSGTLLWSSIQASAGFDVGYGVVTDSLDNIYVAGYYSGAITLGSTALTCSGADDIFIEKFDTSGNVLWAKRSGGSASDHCFGLAINSLNELIVGGGFQGTGIFDSFSYTDATGTYDAYAGKLIQPVTASFSASGGTVCVNGSVSFTDLSLGFPTAYEWSFPGGSPSVSSSQHPIVTYPVAGTYDVQLIVTHGPNVRDTLLMPAMVQVVAPNAVNISTSDSVICPGATTTLNAGMAHHALQWSTGDTVSSISVGTTGIYTLTALDANNCYSTDTIQVSSHVMYPVDLPVDTVLCAGQSILLDAGPGYDVYSWSTSATGQQIAVNTSGEIEVTVTDSNACTSSDSITITVAAAAEIFSDVDTLVCPGVGINLEAGTGFTTYLWSDSTTGNTIFVSEPGTYWVKCTDGYGCVVSDTIEFNHYPSPAVNLGPDTVLCIPDAIVIDAGAGFAAYWWSNGSNSSSVLIDSTAEVWVQVENVHNCTAQDTVMVVVDDCLKVPAQAKENISFVVYPNPAHDQVRLELDAGALPAELTIYGVNAQVIHSLKLTTTIQAIDLNQLGAGIYLFTVRSALGIQSRKVIIE